MVPESVVSRVPFVHFEDESMYVFVKQTIEDWCQYFSKVKEKLIEEQDEIDKNKIRQADAIGVKGGLYCHSGIYDC
jgi:hypothetical protein